MIATHHWYMDDDLPGEIIVSISDAHPDLFFRNAVHVVVEHVINNRKMSGGWVTVTREALVDLGRSQIEEFAFQGAERFIAPWRFPDPPLIAAFDLFPIPASLCRWVQRQWRAIRLFVGNRLRLLSERRGVRVSGGAQ